MLAILTTHAIQYQMPLWKELVYRGVPLEVWYLSDHGHRCSPDREFGQEFSWDLDMLEGYPYRLLPTRPAIPDIGKFWGTRIGSLASPFQDQRITALLINGWVPIAYWQAAFQAHRAGIPVLLRGETNDLRRVLWLKERAKRRLLKLLFSRVSVFLTVGVANRRFYLKYGVPESKLGAALYCVDNQRFSEAAKSFRSQRAELRGRWGIPQNSTCFVFCGKLIEKKHVHDLISALRTLLARPSQFDVKGSVHLLIAGDGPLRASLQEAASQLRDGTDRPCITFAGFLNQTEIPKAYAVADCLVMPSDYEETWGLVANEAMASGLPCIVSDQVGCGPDLVTPGVTGDLFPTGDIQSLAHVMAQWSDRARCQSAAPAVQEKIVSYSIEQAATGIQDALHRLISERQKN